MQPSSRLVLDAEGSFSRLLCVLKSSEMGTKLLSSRRSSLFSGTQWRWDSYPSDEVIISEAGFYRTATAFFVLEHPVMLVFHDRITYSCFAHTCFYSNFTLGVLFLVLCHNFRAFYFTRRRFFAHFTELQNAQ